MVECAIISENLGFGCTGVQTAIEGIMKRTGTQLTPIANGLAEAPLIVGASHELKQKYLGRMSETPLVASYAVVSGLGDVRSQRLLSRSD